MRKIREPLKKLEQALVIISLTASLLLSACQSALPQTNQLDPPTNDIHKLLQVEIDGKVDRAELEAQYGATALMWQPEAGVAILAFDDSQKLQTQANENLEQNDNAISLPLYLLSRDIWSGSRDIWSGSRDIWSGSRDIWSGGRDIWSGGRDIWSGGVDEAYLTANGDNWQQIELFSAHAMTDDLGTGVMIALIDSGIDINHPLLASSLSDSGLWYDFVDRDAIPQEVGVDGSGYGHGTAMAGIMVQVAPQAKIMPLRVLNSNGQGDLDDLVRAVVWAVAHGADIINLSLGSDKNSGVIKGLIKFAAANGVYVVASAGNSGEEALTYPAALAKDKKDYAQYLLSVGSVDAEDIKSLFSAYGEGLELLAPGEDVYTSYPDSQLIHVSGTSASSAMTSAVLALGLAHRQSQAADVLIENAVDVSTLSGNAPYVGKLGKRIDASAYLEAILP
ncbi:MAG: S8 family serine peptidase [Deinococcales bacterium]